MLHGYNQGHNLIQGSIVLPSSEDMDCMATLSDWSEYINPQDEADYITIYPLKNSEYYVISKTWYANEMKRPGCVWTHSLLISFQNMRVHYLPISLLFHHCQLYIMNFLIGIRRSSV